MAHAFLPPSGAANWVACPAWARMNQQFPELSDQTAADEGTQAHAALAAAITTGAVPADDAVNEALAFISTLPVKQWDVEKTRHWRRVPENFGTPDLVGWDGVHLYVVDYKHGHGYVEHENNHQLVNYAALVLEDVPAEFKARVICHLIIVQPRCYKAEAAREWVVSATDLRGPINILTNQAGLALQENPPARTGPQCLHCNGRHACATLRNATSAAIDFSGVARASVPTEAEAGAELRLVREALDRLKAIESGLAEQVAHHIKSGARVPGWSLQAKPGREDWKVPPESVLALGVPAKPPVPVTPNQARKAGLPAEIVALMSERKNTAPELVRSNPKEIFK